MEGRHSIFFILVCFVANFKKCSKYAFLGGYTQIITILHKRGGSYEFITMLHIWGRSSQCFTILHRGIGSLGTPNFYEINGQPPSNHYHYPQHYHSHNHITITINMIISTWSKSSTSINDK